MKELIKISKSKELKSDIVDARELHEFLNIKSRFNDWIKNYIKDFGFVENVDYCTFTKNLVTENTDGLKAMNTAKEYAIKLDMAKELSMLQRTEKGKQARLYFIECEKQLIKASYQIPNSFAEALRLAAAQAEQLELQQKEIKTLGPKAETYDNFMSATNNITVGILAKELCDKDVKIGQNKLFKYLREKEILISKGSMRNTPYQRYIDSGLFIVKTNPIKMGNEIKNVNQTFVTPKGQEYILKLFKK